MKLTINNSPFKPGTLTFDVTNYLDYASRETTVGKVRELLAEAIREQLTNDPAVKQMVKEAIAEALSKFDKEIVIEGVKAIAAKAYAPGQIMYKDLTR